MDYPDELLRLRIDFTRSRVDGEPTLDEIYAAVPQETKDVLDRVRGLETALLDRLARDPGLLEAFVRAPAEVVEREFPEIHLPRHDPEMAWPFAGFDRFDLALVIPGQATPALSLFAKVWEWVAASTQNTNEFLAAPSAAVRAIGTQEGASAPAINEVVGAIETVFGIRDAVLDDLNRAVATRVLP